mmetsp:Transcript_88339/g.248826  ORF Transcript_88339/g.248826 Transcript_88339/m.248826 type:complete len:300 (-) Transcript_88339:29-928(-)
MTPRLRHRSAGQRPLCTWLFGGVAIAIMPSLTFFATQRCLGTLLHNRAPVRLRARRHAAQSFAACWSWPRLRSSATTARAATFGDIFGTKVPEGHDATVIWMHGLGDTGRGWAAVAQQGSELRRLLPATRFLFPTAPTQPVTVNGGMAMPSWFDIASLDPKLFAVNPAGLADSVAYVQSLVQQQVDAGVPPGRVVLVGFSQGAGVALATAFSAPQRLGGVLSLSGFLASTLPPEPATLPVHFFHGEADPMVPLDWGRRSCDMLRAASVQATFRSYPGLQHDSCEAELRDVAAVLSEILG